LIERLCREKTKEADCEAVGLIEKYGSYDLLNYNDIKNQECCIHSACREGRSKVVKALLDKDSDPNNTDKEGITGLH